MDKVRIKALLIHGAKLPTWRRGWLMALILLVALSSWGCQGSNQKEVQQILDHAEGFLRDMNAAYQKGLERQAEGLTLQAEHAYRYALSSVSAMGFAIDCLIYIKGEGEAIDPERWSALAAIHYGSPYPYFFEGLVYGVQGDKDYAATCFEGALLNPAFSESLSKPLMGLALLPIKDLKALRERVGIEEQKIKDFLERDQNIHRLFVRVAPVEMTEIERSPFNYSDDYLRTAARAYLSAEQLDYGRALAHYQAALMTDPYDGDNYVGCAVTHLYMNDMESAVFYINEGMFIAPDHEGLAALAEAFNAAEQ